MSTKVLIPLAAAAFFTAVAVPAAGARPETTVPGKLYVIKVTVTDKTITMPADKFTVHGVTRYPRGALIRYSVMNLGTRPYAFEIWGATTGAIRPHGHDTVLVAWNRRGTFLYRTLLVSGKPAGPKGIVKIF